MSEKIKMREFTIEEIDGINSANSLICKAMQTGSIIEPFLEKPNALLARMFFLVDLDKFESFMHIVNHIAATRQLEHSVVQKRLLELTVLSMDNSSSIPVHFSTLVELEYGLILDDSTNFRRLV